MERAPSLSAENPEARREPVDGEPFLLRLAALPSDVVLALGSELPEQLAERAEVVDRLATLRGQWVEALHDAIHDAEPTARRRLLDLKRAAFNGRAAGRFRDREHWGFLRGAGLDLGRRVVDEEARLERLDAAFDAAFQACLSDTRERLLATLASDDFADGVALASRDLATGIDRLRRARGRRGRKERKAEISLWRYVTRAALKPSPFASLTRVAPALATDGTADDRRLTTSLETRGSLRVQRYVLDQLWHVLRRWPAIRDRLLIRREPSASRGEDDRWRLVRPPAWIVKDGNTVFRSAGVVAVRLGGPLIERLVDELPEGAARPVSEVVSALAGDASDERREALLGQIETLVGVGFLRFDPPWSTFEPVLEATMAAWLRDLREPRLDAVVEAFDRLLAGLRDAGVGRGDFATLDELLDALWHQATEPVEPRPGLVRAKPIQFYEDAVAEPAEGPASVALRPAREPLIEALEEARSYARLVDAMDRRHDVQGLVADWLRREHGDRPVGVVDAFAGVWPIVNRWLRGEPVEQMADSYPTLESWRALRRELVEAVATWPWLDSEDRRIDPAQVAALAARLPEPSRGIGHTWFLQPTDERGERFVLHRVEPGTGRHLARFVALFDPTRRDRWCRRARAGGERFVDVPSSAYENLNIHAAQTPWVLDSPIEPAGHHGAGVLGLADLQLRLDGDRPRVEDRQGHLRLPVHLGASDPGFSQAMHRFLTLLGPGCSGLVGRLGADAEGTPGVLGRLSLGERIVLRRRRFLVDPAPLLAQLERADGSDAFRRLDRWRRAVGVPRRCFWHEELADGTSKPQYIDFSSPLVVDLLRGALGASLWRFDEALPGPDAAWPDRDGQRWVAEWLIDDVTRRSGDSA